MYKRIMLFFGVLLLSFAFSYEVIAQEVNRGVRGGLTMSSLYVDVDNLDDEDARFGFHVGLFSQIMYTPSVGIQPELIFTTKGSKAYYGGLINQNVEFGLSYVDLPVLLVIRPMDLLEIHAGPYGGLMLGSNIRFSGTIEGEDDIDRDQFNTIDYGFAFGVQLNTGIISAGLRYNLGRRKLADSDVTELLLGDSKHSYGQLFVALRF